MTALRYLSVCSGIEAASVAWHPLGWTPVAFAEIEIFPSTVLAHHYPTVPNWGDLTKFKDWPDATFDVLVGGTPCQSFSVAGLRKGLDDPRGNLALTYLAVLDRYRPTWCVWENVPGVLSSGGGRDFGAFLGALGQLGYGFAYRVLDAQFFGVAQRRRRVFVVGCLGGWQRAAAVLFDGASLRGNPAPRRDAREGATGTVTASAARRRGNGIDPAALTPETVGALCDGAHMGGGLTAKTRTAAAYSPCVANPLTARMGKGINTTCDEGQTPVVEIGGSFDDAVAFKASHFTRGKDGAPASVVPPLSREADRGDQDTLIAFSVKDHGADAGPLSPTIRSGGHNTSHANGGVMPAVAFHENQRVEISVNETAGSLKVGGGKPGQGYPAVAFTETGATLKGGSGARGYPDPSDGNGHNIVGQAMKVRRLTPRECERLQGFPDDYTLIPYRGKLAADGPRYKALGNSMAVPVMHWIGRRLGLVHAFTHSEVA